jgi:hypothetical protein
VWPALVREWRIGVTARADWVTFCRVGEPFPEILPPQIDSLTSARLPPRRFPLHGYWELPRMVYLHDVE